MAKQGACYHRRWEALKKLHWVLWMCLVVVENWRGVECLTGCSFSADDWCGFSNVHDGTNGPRWVRKNASVGQIQNARQGLRMALDGSHPMQLPPKGNHYVTTGPTPSDRLTEKNAELTSPLVQVHNTSTCLYFAYHNRAPVKLVPTLAVLKRSPNISDEFQETDETLAAFYSLNSDKWFEAAVRLPVGEYYLIFSGKNYNNRTLTGGQIGITNVAIAEGDCGRSVPEWLTAPGDCGFEGDVELCGYRYSNDSSVQLMGILADSLSPSEQAQRGQRRPPGDRFLAMTSQFYEITNQGSKARLLSPEISIQTEGCLILWYYNSVESKQESNNALNIFRLEEATEHLLFRLPVPRSNRDRWYQLSGALPRGAYQLALEAQYTGDFAADDYVGLDGVETFNRSCSDVKSVADVCDTQGPTGDPVCRNGGTCVGSGKKHFRCECGEGYYGTRCEHPYACSDRNNRCQRGGSCVPDGKVDFRCVCRSGYDGRFCEDVRSCGSPEGVVGNAVLTSNENTTTYGSAARFECAAGWLKYGDLTITCGADGTWGTASGKCVRVDCPQPPIFSGTILVNVTSTAYGGIARYRCPEGMRTADNRDYLVCRAVNINQFLYYNRRYNYPVNYPDAISGQWLNVDSSQHVGCHNIPRCQHPPQIAHANASYTSLYVRGVATYRCNEGYEFGGNWSALQLNCSENSRWNYNDQGNRGLVDFENARYDVHLKQQFQCFRTADCGAPPKVLNSAAVSYSDTKLDSLAAYTCRDGYRLVDSESAVCWAIGVRSSDRWVEWLFVPACEFVCPVREGRRGNLTVAVVRVHDCVLEGVESLSAKLSCVRSMTYSVRRKNFNRELAATNSSSSSSSSSDDSKVVFYGSDLCVAERQTRVKRYGEGAGAVVVQRATKCRSFCLQSPSEVRDVVVFDELTSVPPPNQNRGPGTVLGTVSFETKRKRNITRYEIIGFN